MIWEYGPQDQAARDTYQSYLSGRQATLSSSNSIANQEKALTIQKAQIDVDRTFRTQQIQNETIAIQEGNATPEDKIATLKSLAQQAYANGDVQNGQSIEGMYNTAVIAKQNADQTAANKASSASTAASTAAATTKANQAATIQNALTTAFHNNAPLTDPTTGQYIDPATGEPSSKPMYVNQQQYALAANQATTLKASGLVAQIQSGGDTKGTALKDLTALENTSDFTNAGLKINYNADGTINTAQPVTKSMNQGLYNTLSGNNAGVEVLQPDGTFKLSALPQEADTANVTGKNSYGMPIFGEKSELGDNGGKFDFTRKNSPTDPGSTTDNFQTTRNQSLDANFKPVKSGTKAVYGTGFDPVSGNQVLFAPGGYHTAYGGNTGVTLAQAQTAIKNNVSPTSPASASLSQYSPSAEFNDVKEAIGNPSQILPSLSSAASDLGHSIDTSAINQAAKKVVPGLSALEGTAGSLVHDVLNPHGNTSAGNLLGLGGINMNNFGNIRGIAGGLIGGAANYLGLGGAFNVANNNNIKFQAAVATAAQQAAAARQQQANQLAQQQYAAAQAAKPTVVRVNPTPTIQATQGVGPIAQNITNSSSNPSALKAINAATGFGNELKF